jgi:hypothetical protein
MLVIIGDGYHLTSSQWLAYHDALLKYSALSNQYMNAVIAFEVMSLLSHNKNCQHYHPPTFKKVTLQFGIVSLYAVALTTIKYHLLHIWVEPTHRQLAKRLPYEPWSIIVFYCFVTGISSQCLGDVLSMYHIGRLFHLESGYVHALHRMCSE